MVRPHDWLKKVRGVKKTWQGLWLTLAVEKEKSHKKKKSEFIVPNCDEQTSFFHNFSSALISLVKSDCKNQRQ